MPIGDMPILEVMLHRIKAAGIEQVVLTVGHLSELLRAFFKDGSQLGLDITYSYEQCPLGTAGPIALVDGLDETFLVSNGDVLTTLDLTELIRFHQEQKAIATIAAHHRQSKIDLGVIQRDGGLPDHGLYRKTGLRFPGQHGDLRIRTESPFLHSHETSISIFLIW